MKPPIPYCFIFRGFFSMLMPLKTILYAIVVFSALFLMQCQYAKQVLNDLNNQVSEEKSSSSLETEKSSSSAAKKTRKEAVSDNEDSSSSQEAEKSSSSEIKKTRKEVNP